MTGRQPIFRLVSALLWIVKGTLLAIALAALVLWPRGYWQKGSARESALVESNASAALEWRWLSSECGYVWVSIYRMEWTGTLAANELHQSYLIKGFKLGWSKGSQDADREVLRYGGGDIMEYIESSVFPSVNSLGREPYHPSQS